MPQKLPEGQRNRTITIPVVLDDEIQGIADAAHTSWTKTGVLLLREALAAREGKPGPGTSAVLAVGPGPPALVAVGSAVRVVPPAEVMDGLGVWGEALAGVARKVGVPADTILIDLLRRHLKDYLVQASSEGEALRQLLGPPT